MVSWWQMISCLICASSILLVAGICINLESESESQVFKDIDWLAVDEDAEVCLQVFQALSSNSNAARLARDMMQRLKKTRTISYGKATIYATRAMEMRAFHLGSLERRSISHANRASVVHGLSKSGEDVSTYLTQFYLCLDPADVVSILSGDGNGHIPAASVPTVHTGPENMNDAQTSTEPFRSSTQSHFDFGMPSQESFDLMFQRMPYEASDPVLCEILPFHTSWHTLIYHRSQLHN